MNISNVVARAARVTLNEPTPKQKARQKNPKAQDASGRPKYSVERLLAAWRRLGLRALWLLSWLSSQQRLSYLPKAAFQQLRNRPLATARQASYLENLDVPEIRLKDGFGFGDQVKDMVSKYQRKSPPECCQHPDSEILMQGNAQQIKTFACKACHSRWMRLDQDQLWEYQCELTEREADKFEKAKKELTRQEALAQMHLDNPAPRPSRRRPHPDQMEE
jgi:hypothetical protein